MLRRQERTRARSVLADAIAMAVSGPRLFSRSGVAILGATLFALPASPVMAQDEAAEVEEITVTGSRIRRQDFTANSPITTVDSETFENTSTIGIESVLNRLPQFVPAVTQFTTTDVQNTATNTIGASTVSLRGLGANRNLVLLDGRRAQPVNAALVVDTNTIPTAAIERVEVISGGPSAVYGADAVGGVVNFILKDDFEGMDVDVQYGLTEQGDGEELRTSALFGANLIEGGNVMFGIEYADRQEVEQTERDWRVSDLNNPSVPGSEFWFSETFVTSSTPGNYPNQNVVDDIFSQLTPGTIAPRSDFFINPTADGTGTVFTGAGTFTGAAGAPGAYRYEGPLERPEYPGEAWRKFNPDGSIDENQLNNWLSIPMDRFSTFGRGSFDINDNTTALIQGNFSRTRNETLLGQYAAALGRHGAPVPYGSETYGPSLSEDGVTTNPAYLPGGVYGLNCPETGGCTESQAFPLPAEMRALLDSRDNPNDDIMINRNLDFMGSRRSRNETTTFQIVAGLEGEMDNGWFWDAHSSHGQTETVSNFLNFSSVQRWRALVASPNFGRAFSRTGNEVGGGGAAGTATCTTGLPIVQEFTPSEDCIAAMGVNLQNNSELEQTVVEANLSGDVMELPSGALQFAVGAAWRENTYRFTTDNLTLFESFVEQAVGLRPGGSSEGQYDVGEIYGEVLVPVIADAPLIRRLNLELGGRYSDYSTVGGVNTYKALVDWEINDWSRIRGGYQKANRAPNIGELFLSRTQTFGGAGIYGDQCSMNNDIGPYSPNPQYNIGGAEGAAFARRICEELMGSTGADVYYGRPVEDQPEGGGASSPNVRGNPELDSEEADTWTLGVVLNSPFQGAFLSGFTTSVDYYNIEITDMIATESGDAVYQRCLDPSINTEGSVETQACQSIQRDPLTGNPIGLDITYTNQGRAETSGIDLQVDWSGEFATLGLDAIPGGMSVNILANYNLENITQEQEGLPEIDWAGTQGCALGLECMGYDYRIFSTFNYFVGPFNATLRWQHLPSIEADTYATDPNTTDIGVPESYNIFALTGGYRLNENIMLRFGVENLFDEEPPMGGGDPDAAAYPQAMEHQYGAYYDPLGRRYFAGFNINF